MVLAIIGLCVVLFIACAISYRTYSDFDELFVHIGTACLVIAVFCIIGALILGICVSNLTTVDERIAMYEEENAKIEEQIAVVVKQYQDYESEIFAECTPESAITLVSLYPELKADTLVQTQIDIYIKNNTAIRELREEQINGRVLKWWLYFGG